MTRTRVLLAVGLLLSLLVAGVASHYASSAPDGLEKVAADKGFDETARDHDLAGSPFADYQTDGVGDRRLSGGLAGITGVALTGALACGLFLVLRRRRPPAPGRDEALSPASPVPSPTPASPASPASPTSPTSPTSPGGG